MKRRRWAPGLRARLLAALLLTSAVTLIAAALVLLPSLQDRLASQSQDALQGTARASRSEIEGALERDGGTIGGFTNGAASRLAQRSNSQVFLWQVADGGVQPRYPSTSLQEIPRLVYQALTFERPASTTEGGSTRLALPLTPGSQDWVLELRQSDTAVSDAVAEVRKAFLVAAGVGLIAALLLGIALSTTLSRRLGRLRAGALRLAREGPSAPPPEDDAEDEIGDLSRAFGAMQLALRRQEDARKAFVATASHELRTPLTSLQGTLELLAEDLDSERPDLSDARDQVGRARSELRRLASLATELLDLSRLDAEVELRSEPVELSELARAVTSEFQIAARDRGIRLEFREPKAAVWARGDPGAVARIVRILLDNSLRFAPEGEPIMVEPSYRGETATLTVTDTGPGIPEPEREAVFERFQRGSMTGGEGGFGLGLAIGRELADRLGGGLKLDTAYENGARFVFTLPIEPPG